MSVNKQISIVGSGEELM